EIEREKRRSIRVAWQTERLRLVPADAALQKLRVQCNRLSAAALIVAGFHERHGQWRQWNPMRQTSKAPRAKPRANDSRSAAKRLKRDKPIGPEDVAALKDLVERANAGDADALGDLRRLLDSCPEIWSKVGD